jgi:hypothetical protein
VIRKDRSFIGDASRWIAAQHFQRADALLVTTLQQDQQAGTDTSRRVGSVRWGVDLRLDGLGEGLDAAGGSVDADWADSVTITSP